MKRTIINTTYGPDSSRVVNNSAGSGILLIFSFYPIQYKTVQQIL